MSPPPYGSLVDSARRRWAAGASARAVYVEFVVGGVAPGTAAVAGCVAGGSSESEANARLRPFDGLWDVLEPGEEDTGAELLAAHGYFEPTAVLGEQEQATRARLQAALACVHGVPSGYAVRLFTDLRTGRLPRAFVTLEQVRDTTEPATAWNAVARLLVAATGYE